MTAGMIAERIWANYVPKGTLATPARLAIAPPARKIAFAATRGAIK
jgi:hypothetical protein